MSHEHEAADWAALRRQMTAAAHARDEMVARFTRYVRAAQAYIHMLNVENYSLAVVDEYYAARQALTEHGDVPDIDVPTQDITYVGY